MRLVIYFDQQIMKDFTTETSNITNSFLEPSTSLVCMRDLPSNLSNESSVQVDSRVIDDRGSEDEEYKGIGNMVRSENYKIYQ